MLNKLRNFRRDWGNTSTVSMMVAGGALIGGPLLLIPGPQQPLGFAILGIFTVTGGVFGLPSAFIEDCSDKGYRSLKDVMTGHVTEKTNWRNEEGQKITSSRYDKEALLYAENNILEAYRAGVFNEDNPDTKAKAPSGSYRHTVQKIKSEFQEVADRVDVVSQDGQKLNEKFQFLTADTAKKIIASNRPKPVSMPYPI